MIVQSDSLATPREVLLCPFTSTLIDAPLYRLSVRPDDTNALVAVSQLMVDKIGPAMRDKIDGVIGRLSPADLYRLGTALAMILDLTS